MFPRIQGLFHSSSADKRAHTTECGENSLTIVTEKIEDKKIEDDSSSGENVEIDGKDDSSSGENVEIDGKNGSSSGENVEIDDKDDSSSGENVEIDGKDDSSSGENVEIDGKDDSSSGENVEIDDKSLPELETLPEPATLPAQGHSAQCNCPNCDEIVSRFSECGICLEPLQCCGPCACSWCGGVWCSKCSRRVSRCAWCRAPLRAPAPPCLALQRLVNEMLLPCRNYRRGCTEYLTATTRVKHEEDCKYDQMTCPIAANCCSVSFEDLSKHLQSTHNIIAVYSQKIKILIENFQTKLKKTACCRTKYKIILLHHKSAFVIKVCIYNYHVKVEVMRRKLGYSAETKEPKKSAYCAVIEFQSKALCTKSAVMIENETYSKKAEVQWNDVVLKTDADEAITIHVNIGKSEVDHVL